MGQRCWRLRSQGFKTTLVNMLSKGFSGNGGQCARADGSDVKTIRKTKTLGQT